MEHLCLPDGAKSFIVAPYEAPEGEQYNGEGFLAFPYQRGWTEEQIFGEDEESESGFIPQKSYLEIEQFFQTWLFFGLAIEVLKMGGVIAQTDDFLQDRGQFDARIICTSKLPNFLVHWEKGIKEDGDVGETWYMLDMYFDRAAFVLDRFCKLRGENLPLEMKKPRPWPVRDEISTTMIALVTTLRRAAIIACGVKVDPQGPWPEAARSTILARRLDRKWCAADVTTILKQLPIDGVYYLTGYQGLDPDELDHHANCVKEHCLYQYDQNMYITKHTSPEYHKQNCRSRPVYGGHLGPERGQKGWDDAIARILDKQEDGEPAAIPIALWVKGLRKLWSVEYHFTGARKPDYVAISHVWTDGKGNPRENALPECQIDKIQNLIEGVTWEGRKEPPSNNNESNGIGFWMDTLCVPAKSTVVQDKNGNNKDLKAVAIQTMRHVYTNAKAVLVLDEWIESIPSTAPPLEVTARLFQSNWLKRLWTHQEGFLPPALWFQFQDRSVEIHNLNSRIDEHVTMLQNQGLYLGFPRSANMRLLKLYSDLEKLMKATSNDAKWTLYNYLAAHMSERQTSRLADEIICLATIIDVPIEEFLKTSSKPDDVAGERRMQRFLEMLGRFEHGIIFNNYERLTERGYKWAPKSLLNIRNAELIYNGDATYHNYTAESNWSHQTDTPFEKVNGQLGLLVQYRGLLVNFSDGKPSFAAAERGCAIQFKGDGDTNMEIDGKWLIVQLHPNKATWNKLLTYAVILSEVPSPRWRAPAVVASVIEGPTRGVYTVEHESIATVWVQDERPPYVDTVEAALLDVQTPWLVV